MHLRLHQLMPRDLPGLLIPLDANFSADSDSHCLVQLLEMHKSHTSALELTAHAGYCHHQEPSDAQGIIAMQLTVQGVMRHRDPIAIPASCKYNYLAMLCTSAACVL